MSVEACREVRGWLVGEIFRLTLSENPEFQKRRSFRNHVDGSYVALFRMSVNAAHTVMRHVVSGSEHLDLPSGVRVWNSLLEDLRTHIDRVGLTQEDLEVNWYLSDDRPEVRERGERNGARRRREETVAERVLWRLERAHTNRRLRGFRHSPSDSNDISWLWSRDVDRLTVLHNATFLRGFLEPLEFRQFLEDPRREAYHDGTDRILRGDFFGDNPNSTWALMEAIDAHWELQPSKTELLDQLPESDFQQLIERIVKLGVHAPSERNTHGHGWLEFIANLDGDTHRAAPELHEHPTGRVYGATLDAGIAMWVRTFLAAGITTTSSCSGHYHASAQISFASGYDRALAEQILIQAGANVGFKVHTNSLILDPESLYSEEHFRMASDIYARRAAIREMAKVAALETQEWEFKGFDVAPKSKRERYFEDWLRVLVGGGDHEALT